MNSLTISALIILVLAIGALIVVQLTDKTSHNSN
jgi:hypothetical protein